MKIKATVRFGKTAVPHTWEYLKASESHYVVILRLQNEIPLGIRMTPDQIRTQGMGKIYETYLGELNASDAFLLKRV